jgi:hypothetical protein
VVWKKCRTQVWKTSSKWVWGLPWETPQTLKNQKNTMAMGKTQNIKQKNTQKDKKKDKRRTIGNFPAKRNWNHKWKILLYSAKA